MSTRNTSPGLCLFCLKDVDLTSPNSTSSRSSSSLATGIVSNSRNIVALCRLVQYPKFEDSTPHQNMIQEHDGESWVLCQDCLDLSDTALSVREQILQLQSELRTKVTRIRKRILESDAERLESLEQGGGQSFGSKGYGYEATELNRLLPIRQSLLRLSDEDDTTLLGPEDVQVKVKIETEEEQEIEFPVDELLGHCSPAFLLHPDDACFKQDLEDLDELFITPQRKCKDIQPRRASKRGKSTESKNLTLPVPTKKRGRPRKGQEVAKKSIPPPPIKKRKSATKIPSDTSSSSEDNTDSDIDEDHDEPLDGIVEGDDDQDGIMEKPFKCPSCSRIFALEEGLNIHVQKFHSHACNICGKRFRTSKDKSNHEKSEHHGVSPFQCTICSRKFSRKGRLEVHMIVRHETNDKPHTCTRCNKQFTLEQNLERHLELHKIEIKKPVVCEVCDSRFVDTKQLERHAVTHEKSFFCSTCQKSYASKLGLQRHQRRHNNEKTVKCDHCEEMFIDKGGKDWHTSKFHSTPDQHHLCPICGKSFFNVNALKAHLDRHAGKQNVTCEKCGEKCSDSGSLKTHNIQKHDGEPLICEECGAKFMTSRGLVTHKMSHAGLKPFKCDVCDARFLSKWVLANHMRSHTGERPFVCEHCRKGFKAKKHLDYHVKSIHSENFVMKTPHRCSYCGKEYPRKGILDGHIRQVHTGERPFVCQVCSKGFALNTTLTLHLKSHGINNVSSSSGQRLPRSKRENPSTTTVSGRGPKKVRNVALNVDDQILDHSSINSTSSDSMNYGLASPAFPHNFAPATNSKFPLVNNIGGSSTSHHSGNPSAPSTPAVFFNNNPSLRHNYYHI